MKKQSTTMQYLDCSILVRLKISSAHTEDSHCNTIQINKTTMLSKLLLIIISTLLCLKLKMARVLVSSPKAKTTASY